MASVAVGDRSVAIGDSLLTDRNHKKFLPVPVFPAPGL
jgi:hypothetical protein